MAQLRKFSRFEDLQGASLAEKLMLGIEGFDDDANRRRWELAERIESDRRQYRRIQAREAAALSDGEVEPEDLYDEDIDYSQAALITHRGDIQAVMNSREPFFNFAPTYETPEALQAAVEELHNEHGLNFKITEAEHLYHAPVAQQISLGIEGNDTAAQERRFYQARRFRSDLEGLEDEQLFELNDARQYGYEDVLTENEIRRRYATPFGISANLEAAGNTERVLENAVTRAAVKEANLFEGLTINNRRLVEELREAQVVSNDFEAPNLVEYSSQAGLDGILDDLAAANAVEPEKPGYADQMLRTDSVAKSLSLSISGESLTAREQRFQRALAVKAEFAAREEEVPFGVEQMITHLGSVQVALADRNLMDDVARSRGYGGADSVYASYEIASNIEQLVSQAKTELRQDYDIALPTTREAERDPLANVSLNIPLFDGTVYQEKLRHAAQLYSETVKTHQSVAHRMTLGIPSNAPWANDLRYDLAREIQESTKLLQQDVPGGDELIHMPYGIDQLVRHRGDAMEALADRTLPQEYLQSLGFAKRAYEQSAPLRDDVRKQFAHEKTVLEETYGISDDPANPGLNVAAPTVSNHHLPPEFSGEGKIHSAMNLTTSIMANDLQVYNDVTKRLASVEDRLMLDVPGHSAADNAARLDRALEVQESVTDLQVRSSRQFDMPYGIEALIEAEGDAQKALKHPQLKEEIAREWEIYPHELDKPRVQADLDQALQTAAERMSVVEAPSQVEATPLEGQVGTTAVKKSTTTIKPHKSPFSQAGAARIVAKPSKVEPATDSVHREPPPYAGPHAGGPSL